MTKSELYETIIDGQRRHGQGLSGIVRALGENAETIGEYLDELIEEGLIKRCETGGSLGHPESNRFYMPTTGYNVWEDARHLQQAQPCLSLPQQTRADHTGPRRVKACPEDGPVPNPDGPCRSRPGHAMANQT